MFLSELHVLHVNRRQPYLFTLHILFRIRVFVSMVLANKACALSFDTNGNESSDGEKRQDLSQRRLQLRRASLRSKRSAGAQLRRVSHASDERTASAFRGGSSPLHAGARPSSRTARRSAIGARLRRRRNGKVQEIDDNSTGWKSERSRVRLPGETVLIIH